MERRPRAFNAAADVRVCLYYGCFCFGHRALLQTACADTAIYLAATTECDKRGINTKADANCGRPKATNRLSAATS